MVDRPLSSENRSSWFIVVYEWQGCQQMSGDPTWWPSAEIRGSYDSAHSFVEELRKGEQPRHGKLTYRNIRGPFSWLEPTL